MSADLEARILPSVLAKYPGVSYVFEGVQREQQEAIGGLQIGFVVALLGIFALLAIPLRSYVQPLIIMSAIPFGLVGAVWGHIAVGLDVTLMSMFGLVALSGVVVNDSLVMVAFINRKLELHSDLATAIREAGVSRFRPILLTSLTTFFGLAPLMLERSFDAAFLVPMAVSLGFGVIFATFITLVLVPTVYLILDDAGRALRRLFGGDEPEEGVPVPVGPEIPATSETYRVFHDALAAAYPQCRMQLRHWVGVKCERHAPRRGQSVSIDRQRALRTMALSLAKHSSMGLKSGL